jgi:hypothetical protein
MQIWLLTQPSPLLIGKDAAMWKFICCLAVVGICLFFTNSLFADGPHHGGHYGGYHHSGYYHGYSHPVHPYRVYSPPVIYRPRVYSPYVVVPPPICEYPSYYYNTPSPGFYIQGRNFSLGFGY